MKLFFFVLFLSISSAYAGGDLKQEGHCSGQLEDNSVVSFSYFSNYEGCPEVITGLIKFSPNSSLGNQKGKRNFENKMDVYTFKTTKDISKQNVHRLSFEDSTGNTSGILDYFDFQGIRQSVTVTCVVTDYEYAECGMN